MTLNDYLGTLKDEDRDAFVKRVGGIGSATVDVYAASLPEWYKEERNCLDVDAVHAVFHYEGPGKSSHYHLLLLDYQYAYWSGVKPFPAWLKAASKASKDCFKATAKIDGTTEDGPLHVFGSHVYDPDERVVLYPGVTKKQPVAAGEIGETK